MTEPIESGWISGNFTNDVQPRSFETPSKDPPSSGLVESNQHEASTPTSSPTPHTVPVVCLRPTQWTVGLESTRRRADFLKEMMVSQGPTAIFEYLQRKPISCVVGPRFSRDEFLNACATRTDSEEDTKVITAESLFSADATGLQCQPDRGSEDTKTSLYIVDRHHTCIALLLLQDDPQFAAFFSELAAKMRRLQQRQGAGSDEFRTGVEAIASDTSTPTATYAQVFISVLDDLSDCDSVQLFFSRLRDRDLIGAASNECPLELQDPQARPEVGHPHASVAAYSFLEMRSDPFKSLSWAARHRGYSSKARIGCLVSNDELTEGPGYSILHWRFWYAPSTWAAYLRRRFLHLTSRALLIAPLLEACLVAQESIQMTGGTTNLTSPHYPDYDDYACLGQLLLSTSDHVLSPAFVKLVLACSPAQSKADSADQMKPSADAATEALLLYLQSKRSQLSTQQIRTFTSSTSSLRWALEATNALCYAHATATAHIFDTATVDQACRFCWDWSEDGEADNIPGFLGHIVRQQRSRTRQTTPSSQATEGKASDIPGSRDFDQLVRSEDITEFAWCHVDTLKPTQRCAGYEAVYAKRDGLERHWRHGGRSALRKTLMKKAVPCVVAPIEASPSYRRVRCHEDLLQSRSIPLPSPARALQSVVYTSLDDMTDDGMLWATQMNDDLSLSSIIVNASPASPLASSSRQPDHEATSKNSNTHPTVLFLVDHHHLTLALKTSKIIPESEKFVYVSIALDLRALPPGRVWHLLKQRKLCFLPLRGQIVFPLSDTSADARTEGDSELRAEYLPSVVGQQRELQALDNGQDTYTECWLPETLVQLEDDPFRSIAWYVRNRSDSLGGPGFYKVNVEFFEFTWADYMRAHPLVVCVMRLAIEARLAAVGHDLSDEYARNPWKILQGHEPNPITVDFFVRICKHPSARKLAGYIQSSFLAQSVTLVRSMITSLGQVFSSKQAVQETPERRAWAEAIQSVDLNNAESEVAPSDALQKFEHELRIAALNAVEVLAGESPRVHVVSQSATANRSNL